MNLRERLLRAAQQLRCKSDSVLRYPSKENKELKKIAWEEFKHLADEIEKLHKKLNERGTHGRKPVSLPLPMHSIHKQRSISMTKLWRMSIPLNDVPA